MEGAGLVQDALGRVRNMVRENLKDLSAEELQAPPKPGLQGLENNSAVKGTRINY